ncbi:PH domain-containing protein [Shewanella sp. SR44-4]|jgi:membrane protein YdbS with pleckstrin-like domain|uniref:PH domain-containing protein n=1 Tax=unclassified Shewanella TaxID=196818 RepID=UPI0015FFBED5|nr:MULTISPECIES: PH domain-containing protein [unclassified Shewanella]MBB1363856.1 PH domain-containing protein [Shewanella sp. SR44-4]MBO1895928.1 PH domain-containing protein [Shewanella sp. BF02_Schw]
MDTPPQSKSPIAQPQSTDPSAVSDTNSATSSAGDTLAHVYDHGPRLSQDEYIQLTELPLSNTDPNYPKLLLIISSVVAVIIITVLSAFLLITKPLPLMIASVGLVSAMLLAVVMIKLIHLKAHKIAYGLFKHEMVFREGLFWVSTTALPYTRLQHVNLSQGPLERKYNLVTLKCFSAGSGLAEIDLPGLNADLAEHLRQHLLSQAAASHQLLSTETEIVDPTPSDAETDPLSIQPPQQDNHNG